MRAITACLVCLTLLIISVSTIAQENQAALVNLALPDNNTTLGNNTSAAINASQENQTSLASQIPPGNNTTLENNVSESINASHENETISLPAIHVGMTSTKPVNTLGRQVPKETNNLDVFGNKSPYNISAYSNIKPTYNISAQSYIKPLHTVSSTIKPLFNVENRNPTRPFFNAGESSANIVEELSIYNQSQPVRNLSGYSLVMVPGNIA